VDLGIDGRVALVTASSRGLGRASAEALAAEGARVVVTARGAESLDRAEQEMRAAGADVFGMVADVSDPEVPERLMTATVEPRWPSECRNRRPGRFPLLPRTSWRH
jgi:3-oxoacyl-[acyl-carrier protein] reductase